MNKPTFYVRRGQQVFGPYTTDAIKQYVAANQIVAEDELSHDQRVWKRAREINGLFTQVATVVSPPPTVISPPPTVVSPPPPVVSPPPPGPASIAAPMQPQPMMQQPQMHSVQYAGTHQTSSSKKTVQAIGRGFGTMAAVAFFGGMLFAAATDSNAQSEGQDLLLGIASFVCLVGLSGWIGCWFAGKAMD